jgi:hypothetical protein
LKCLCQILDSIYGFSKLGFDINAGINTNPIETSGWMPYRHLGQQFHVGATTTGILMRGLDNFSQQRGLSSTRFSS